MAVVSRPRAVFISCPLCSSEEQPPAGPVDLPQTPSKRPFILSLFSTSRGLLAVFLFQISADQTRQVGDSIDWVCLAGDWGHTLAMEKEAGSGGTAEEIEQSGGLVLVGWTIC